MNINLLPDWIKKVYLRLIIPVIDFFIKRRLNPNHLTTLGFLISVVATYFFAKGSLRIAGGLMLLGGSFDVIDGKVARATNRTTKFGALYDSTLDRYSEVMIFFGLAYYFVNNGWFFKGIDLGLLTAVMVSVALGGSIMTSYVRARAEGLNLECKVGYMQRPERVVFLAFGAIFHQLTLVFAIFLIAVMSNITAGQRLYHVWVMEKNKNSDPSSDTA